MGSSGPTYPELWQQQGRAASREDPFGFCDPTHPSTGTILFFYYYIYKKKKKKTPVPRILWFLRGHCVAKSVLYL